MTGRAVKLALLAAPDGRIRAAVVDNHGICTCEWMHELVHDGSIDKTRSFLEAIARDGAAYDWELVVAIGEELHILHFVGVQLSASQFAIIAAQSADEVADVTAMMRVSNEQANVVRETLKRLDGQRRRNAAQNQEMYEELGRLNNELARAQRDMARANARLERLNDAKNELLGMVAHDLRNPLGAVSSYASILSSGLTGPLNDEQRQFIDRIEKNATFMAKMVEDLLDLSAIESGKINLRSTQFDLDQTVRDVLAIHATHAQSKGIDLNYEAAGPCTVEADRDKLVQVIENLVSNAVKYSPPKTRIEAELRGAGSKLRFAIQDQGPGISEEEQARLFTPFGTTSAQTTGGEKSTGLGLAIVRKIVEAHRGVIGVQSQVGAGSTFWFELPA